MARGQSLTTCAEPSQPGADRSATTAQLLRKEAHGGAGHVVTGRVGKHVKPLVERAILVVNPPTRGFTPLSAQSHNPPGGLESAYSHTRAGTPLHTRGGATTPAPTRASLGNTPACAGRRWRMTSSARRVGEHPRMRGEEGPRGICGTTCAGTPPHARGGDELTTISLPFRGNTPACAGRRLGWGLLVATMGEHPRVRGEEGTARMRTGRATGTPPHARGGGGGPGGPPAGRGNTPACAGRSACPRRRRTRRREHPRMRREEGTRSPPGSAAWGTPPHARGGAAHRGSAPCGPGNTPACAGRRAGSSWASWASEGTPRMRGEELAAIGGLFGDVGTPPHARGGATVRPVHHPPVGNTPACAGRSGDPARRERSTREHPRMRGEESTAWWRGWPTAGTPPHARGGGPSHRHPHRRDGNTPACAGRSGPSR